MWLNHLFLREAVGFLFPVIIILATFGARLNSAAHFPRWEPSGAGAALDPKRLGPSQPQSPKVSPQVSQGLFGGSENHLDVPPFGANEY